MPRVRINFITTQSPANFSGGWSGLSYNLHQALARLPSVDLEYVGPVSPACSKLQKWISKARRLLGGTSRFYPFSEPRLEAFRAEVQGAIKASDYNLFLGVTPWLRCHFSTPYGAYLDACFRTYFHNNLKVREFCPADIRRIEVAEKEWLDGANHVFWASAWSRDEAVRHYGLSAQNHHVVSIGGNLDLPEADTWAGEPHFLFIAQNFALKGGPVACAAFRAVRQRHPTAGLIILGQKPPDEFLSQPGVQYAGYLRKSQPDELGRFRAILASAFCLVHPTTSDIVPQVLIECGYFGCPAIAPRRFAIPEIVMHEKTGLLLDTPFQAAAFEKAMLELLANRSVYERMRRTVRAHCLANFTFQVVAKRIIQAIMPPTLNP